MLDIFMDWLIEVAEYETLCDITRKAVTFREELDDNDELDKSLDEYISAIKDSFKNSCDHEVGICNCMIMSIVDPNIYDETGDEIGYDK